MRHALLVAALVGCAGSDPDTDASGAGQLTDGGLYRVTAAPDPDPPETGDATLGVHIDAAAGGEVVGATLVVTPWMPSMDHGVMGEVTVTEIGGGDYEAGWAYPMPGWWDVTVEIDAEAGHDQVVFGYDVL